MKAIKNKKFIYLIIAAVVVVIVVSGFLNKRPGPGNMKEAGNMQGQAVSISVETQEIGPETIEQYINVSSKVTANNEVLVMPKVSGTVKKVYVNLGDTVKAGDILFEIDASDLRSQIIQLQTSVDSYEIQYNDLLKDLEKTKALYELGAVSKQELDAVQSNADKMKLQLDTAKENLRLAKEKIADATGAQAQTALEIPQSQLEYAKVKAEIDGVISACNVTTGSTASPQSVAMTIVDTDKLKFSFNISEGYINKVSVGSKAYIAISAASDTLYEGTVTYISPAADSTTMLYPVEIYIDNTGNNIKPGMFASIRLVVDRKENTVSVPLNAVLEKGNEKFVYIVDENSIAHKRIVEIGIKNDMNIEITSGVQNREKVVVTGQSFLSDGSAVNVTAEH